MKKNVDAIVLHHVRYGETGLILKCIIPEGRKTFFIRSFHGNRKAKYPFLLHPLTCIEIEYIESPASQSLPLLVSCNLSETNIKTGSNIIRQSVALFFAEVLLRFTPDEFTDKELFPLTYRFARLTEELPQIPNLFASAFLVHLGIAFGIIPEFSMSKMPDELDPSDTFDVFKGKTVLSPSDEITLFTAIARTPIQHYEKLYLPNQLHRKMNEACLKYLFRHQPMSSEIKSLEIIQDVLGINPNSVKGTE